MHVVGPTTQLSTLERTIWELITPAMAEQQVRVVRVQFARDTLQVMLEPEAATAQERISVTLDQCQTASRTISALLDVEDLIAEHYQLEVSSTGLERPLVTAEDFSNYAGQRVMLKTASPVAGARKNTGILRGLEADSAVIELQDGVENVPLSDIKQAELAFSKAEYDEIFRARSDEKVN